LFCDFIEILSWVDFRFVDEHKTNVHFPQSVQDRFSFRKTSRLYVGKNWKVLKTPIQESPSWNSVACLIAAHVLVITVQATNGGISSMKTLKASILVVVTMMSVCALAMALSDQEQSNHPAVFPHTADPIPLGGTNQTSGTTTNKTLPGMYQGGISNVNDTIGTNAVNRGYNNPTLTNRPNPNLQMP
jgi:hypothetical protein